MDVSGLDHSDSDSGDSWTLLDPSPSYGDEAPLILENNSPTEEVSNDIEKDEDTDGISIISDSEPESIPPCEISYNTCIVGEELLPTEEPKTYPLINSPPQFNESPCHETTKESDFLEVNTAKHKTYVHRRNKRLSTVLNIIVLGSVITAAGVAVGHMWGVRDDCTVHSTPSVNKILSNLYKLQEENTFLRNKLRELTFLNNVHNQHRKPESEKLTQKSKSKKDGEELHSKSNDLKCNNGNLDINVSDNEYLRDIERLKNIYKENKSWLDGEIAKRLTLEKESLKQLKRSQKFIREKNGKSEIKKDEMINYQLETDQKKEVREPIFERKVTYADSLKSESQKKVKTVKTDGDGKSIRDNYTKRKPKIAHEAEFDSSMNDEEPKKDDRYVGNKFKMTRKKNDRQKQHKKQKLRNKYEQWEMKHGYMKDYDEFSLNSMQDNDYLVKNADKEQKDSATQTIGPKPLTPNQGKENDIKEKDANWFDKRATIRHEARKKLEKELFEAPNDNTAGWYFRRMQRREQCRAKGDNSTYRKLSKRNMNFKTKH